MPFHTMPLASSPYPGHNHRHTYSPTWRNVICCILLLLICSIPITPASAATTHTALTRLADSLVGAPAPLRADLAQAALLELSAAYAREAQRAREDLRNRPGKTDLRRWANAIDNLAADYASLAATITPMTPVDVSIGPDHDLHLTVDGQPVVVAGPRPREQAALEQRILVNYCTLNLCDPGEYASTAVSLGSNIAISISPYASGAGDNAVITRWSFSPIGPSCGTDDGLEFQFANADVLRQKRTLCTAIVTELQQLAALITRQAAMGIAVDWNALRIEPIDSGAQQVNLNSGGTTIDMPLPFLVALPELFELARPWLAAKVRGETFHLVLINADRLMAPLLVQE